MNDFDNVMMVDTQVQSQNVPKRRHRSPRKSPGKSLDINPLTKTPRRAAAKKFSELLKSDKRAFM